MNRRIVCAVLLAAGCNRTASPPLARDADTTGPDPGPHAGQPDAAVRRGDAIGYADAGRASTRDGGTADPPARDPRGPAAASAADGGRDVPVGARDGDGAALGPRDGVPAVILPEGAPDEIERLRPKLLACYVRALAKDPTLKGPALLGVRVSSTGDPLDVTARLDGFGVETGDCLRSALLSGGYAATLSEERRLSFEVRFVRRP